MTLVRFKVPARPVIEEVSMISESKLNEKRLRGTVIWMFYRKVLRLRAWEPLFCLTEIYTYNGKLRARLRFVFEKKKSNAILTIHISRHELLYFTVAKGSKVFESEACENYTEFDDVFCRYFKRSKPILGLKPGYS